MRILITGGSGFFGRAFTKYALQYELGTVCIYSRNEFNQFQMRQDFKDDERIRWLIGDVRDRDRLRRAMEGVDQVIHAAALKRIEVGAYNPTEMVKTNVVGTMNVIEAAMDAGVKKVVTLSSDKAYEPVSAYGHSKAMAESLTIAANNTTGSLGPLFAVTRYGNVAGSTGSVIPNWRKMIAEGKTTVPVTDPDCTRFWMSANDAAQLVVTAFLNMKGGDMFIPHWLPAFRISDLADAMGVAMQVNGLGGHEKKHESMDRGITSDTARRMTVDEIREALKNV